jgi:hypothetical protein
MDCAGIKKIVYADPSVVTAPITPAIAKSLIQAAITAGNTVDNVHQDTWNLNEDKSSPTPYKNQLTGLPYRFDHIDQGNVVPSFTVGKYDYALKAALIGGNVIKDDKGNAVGWSRPLTKEDVHRALFCLTDDGIWFIFTNCLLIAVEGTTDKAIGISVEGYMQQPDVAGVSAEYNFDESAVGALQAAAPAPANS